MSKSEKLIRTWKNGSKFDVRCDDALMVLRENGFELREDGEHHWLAKHESMRNHPQFPFGRFKINCHYKGKKGHVHPNAINDILKAIDYLEKKNDKS